MVAITHLFAIVSMPVMDSIILSMEVAVLTVMVAMIAMELIVVAVVMMAMDVAAIFIVRMTGFMAVVVAGSLCRCGSFGTDIPVLFVRIHKMDSFLRRQVDRLQ